MSFKELHSFIERSKESDRIKEKYPDRIPVICESDPKAGGNIQLKKNKYLVPDSLTVGQFMFVLRKQMNLKPEESIFLLFNNTLAETSMPMSRVYSQHKDYDGFVYGFVQKESVFGCLVL